MALVTEGRRVMKDRILQAALLSILLGSYVKTLPGVSVFSVGVTLSIMLVAFASTL